MRQRDKHDPACLGWQAFGMDDSQCNCGAELMDAPPPFWRVLAYAGVLIACLTALLWLAGLTGGGVYLREVMR